MYMYESAGPIVARLFVRVGMWPGFGSKLVGSSGGVFLPFPPAASRPAPFKSRYAGLGAFGPATARIAGLEQRRVGQHCYVG